jgi:cytochrome c peroxidase
LRYILISIGLFILLCGSVGFTGPVREDKLEGRTVEYFKVNSAAFATAIGDLKTAIADLKADSTSIEAARHKLADARLAYKNLQFFFEYFFPPQAIFYNAPAKVEVEDPFIELDDPRGLQVIESLLFDDPLAHKAELVEQIELLDHTARDLPALIYNFKATDKQILESLRLELVRVIALTITGYDAPMLKTGIKEAFNSTTAIKYIVEPYLQSNYKGSDSLAASLNKSLLLLKQNQDFDSFDRMAFLTSAALPLQQELGRFIKANQLELNTSDVLNYDAANIFSANALRVPALATSTGTNSGLAELGQELFFEKALSGDGKRSCASCHQPEKFFTDALPKSVAADGHSSLNRNAPSVLYSALQTKQFWDGRAESLEEQVEAVLFNTNEMNSSRQLLAGLKKNVALARRFQQVFSDSVTINHSLIGKAIAAYLQTLQPFNSAFDRYIAGDETAMTSEQIRGFNLFMGKAQCGTCHFAPVFNGLIPPLYQRSEFEVLGTTSSDDLEHPQLDKDLGRYEVFQAGPYQRAFKTPTIRNASKTAPFMHNGGFKDLSSVLNFYNLGGGAGLGVNVTNQTLSAVPLHLSGDEMKDIISFIDALTDTIPTSKLPN